MFTVALLRFWKTQVLVRSHLRTPGPDCGLRVGRACVDTAFVFPPPSVGISAGRRAHRECLVSRTQLEPISGLHPKQIQG